MQATELTPASHGVCPPATHLSACLECDQLLDIPDDQPRPRCPRCGAAQAPFQPFDPTRPLALALAALILAIPANLYPQMAFSLLGRPNAYTLAGGAWHLIDVGFWWVGALVLVCTLVAPLVLLSLIIGTCLAWKLHLPSSWIASGLKLYHQVASWVMLDVYLLAVIVSVVKLKDMGSFELTTGFFCFVLMLVLLSVAMVSFNTERFWDLWEARRAGH
ncbi:paraquat-inducible protein A [Gilvimarinus algae]|uniref:Paraquat-inducible protein A n=1 Tax=Gilvimarinus algae TaxID=3058037 RepID=A0ABT8TIR6_9GAMM|nr:paraquat-inducible protein A [Gilvimarinus sp. SDUM040014]MDO3383826.1 paraquat-inducible protein A [Gilvimarinus sp. SDUM040014]